MDARFPRGQALTAAVFQAFRDMIRDVHGVNLAEDPPPNVVPVIDSRF
jgi:hypothetical protein